MSLTRSNFLYLLFFMTTILSCRQKPANSVEKADSANRANLDTNLQNNNLVIDENSSAYLVRAANNVLMEKEIAYMAMHQGVQPKVKDLASRLYHELIGIDTNVKALARKKEIVIPTTLSQESRDSLVSFKKWRGNQVDQMFLNYVRTNHESMIKMFQAAMTEAKDEDIRSFADLCFLLFRNYLKEANKL